MNDNKDSSDIIEVMFSEQIKNNNTIMSKNLKRHLVSALITFGSTFLVTLSLSVGADGFTFTQESLVALFISALVAGVRSVAKLIIELNSTS